MTSERSDGVDLRELLAIVRRRWWIIVLVPVVAAAALLWRTWTTPYQTTVRATVLIPGDTEIPGSAERPELMVLDDLPPLVDSRAFAEGVHAALGETSLTVEDVRAALSGERYSRVLTVRVTRESADEARAIGEAVAASLPELINHYLVAEGSSEPATVRIIDPPGDPTRSRPGQALRALIILAVGVAAGLGLAVLIDFLDPRLRSADQVERLLGIPVLADLRGRRGAP